MLSWLGWNRSISRIKTGSSLHWSGKSQGCDVPYPSKCTFLIVLWNTASNFYTSLVNAGASRKFHWAPQIRIECLQCACHCSKCCDIVGDKKKTKKQRPWSHRTFILIGAIDNKEKYWTQCQDLSACFVRPHCGGWGWGRVCVLGVFAAIPSRWERVEARVRCMAVEAERKILEWLMWSNGWRLLRKSVTSSCK